VPGADWPGLSGASFNLVLSAFTKLLAPEKRGIALGAGTAAASFGQFLFAPFGVAMIDNFGWQAGLMAFAGLGPSINNRVIIATDREDLLGGIHNDGSRDVAWWDDSSRSGARRAEALSRDGPCSE
jgi:MFS family permease